MKAQDIQSLLLALITRAENNRQLLTELAKNLEEDYSTRQELFDIVNTQPKYMNFVLAEEAEKETKVKSIEIRDLVSNMDAVLSAEAAAYKAKLKLIRYEFDFEK